MKQSQEIRKNYAQVKQQAIKQFFFGKDRTHAKENWYLANLVLKHGAIISSYHEIQTENERLFKAIQDHYKDTNTSESWTKEENWSLKNIFPARWEAQQKFLAEQFIPLLSKDAVLFDMACASGEWTRMVAPSVQHIDGYEYAQSMVDFATKKDHEEGNANIHYEQADATHFHPHKTYDHGMCLGLFTCLETDASKQAIRNIAASINGGGGYLATKDTLNACGEDTVYHFNYINRYQAIYRSEAAYYKLFTDVGFELVYQTDLDHVKTVSDTEDIPMLSRGAIWKKA